MLTRICKNHLIEAEGILLGVCIIYTIVVPQGVSGPLYIAVTPVAFGYYLAGNMIHKAGTILKDRQMGEKITGKGNIVLLLRIKTNIYCSKQHRNQNIICARYYNI